MNEKHSFVGYMCGIDFFYEEGQPVEGNTIFFDADALKDHPDECGIVKVEVKFLKWEKKPQEGLMPEDGAKIEREEIHRRDDK